MDVCIATDYDLGNKLGGNRALYPEGGLCDVMADDDFCQSSTTHSRTLIRYRSRCTGASGFLLSWAFRTKRPHSSVASRFVEPHAPACCAPGVHLSCPISVWSVSSMIPELPLCVSTPLEALVNVPLGFPTGGLVVAMELFSA